MADYSTLISEEVKSLRSLVNVTNDLVPRDWTFSGEIIVVKGDYSSAITGTVNWHGQRGHCVLSSSVQRFQAHLQPNGSYGRLMPRSEYVTLSAPDNSWTAKYASVSSSRSSRTEDVVDLDLELIEVGNRFLHADISGIIISDVAFEAYPTWFPRDRDETTIDRDGFVTRIFGRTAILRRLRGTQDVVVVFDGLSLNDSEQRALTLLLSFLSGRSGAVTSSFAFSSGEPTYFEHHEFGTGARAGRPPISWLHQPPILFSLHSYFPEMLDRFAALLDEGLRLDVAIGHLLPNENSHSESELRDIILALDSIVESSALTTGKHIYSDESSFAKIAKALTMRATELVSEFQASEGLERSLLRRICTANDATHADKRRALWARVGIELSATEKRALGFRHPMAHSGFVLKTFDDEDLQDLLMHIAVARTLVNRTFLSLLGYRAEILDYEHGENRLWTYL